MHNFLYLLPPNNVPLFEEAKIGSVFFLHGTCSNNDDHRRYFKTVSKCFANISEKVERGCILRKPILRLCSWGQYYETTNFTRTWISGIFIEQLWCMQNICKKVVISQKCVIAIQFKVFLNCFTLSYAKWVFTNSCHFYVTKLQAKLCC